MVVEYSADGRLKPLFVTHIRRSSWSSPLVLRVDASDAAQLAAWTNAADHLQPSHELQPRRYQSHATLHTVADFYYHFKGGVGARQ